MRTLALLLVIAMMMPGLGALASDDADPAPEEAVIAVEAEAEEPAVEAEEPAAEAEEPAVEAEEPAVEAEEPAAEAEEPAAEAEEPAVEAEEPAAETEEPAAETEEPAAEAEEPTAEAEEPAAETEEPAPETEEPVEEVSAEEPANAGENGWVQDGDDWYYYESGKKATNTVKQIGSAWYGFNYNGVMYTNTTFNMYDSKAGRSVYYRAKEDGTLYVNAWFQSDDYRSSTYDSELGEYVYKYYWYYYGEAGKAPYGPLQVGGQWYFFNSNGRVTYNQVNSWEDGYTYVSDDEGHATWLNQNGWTNVNGSYYYSENGTVIKSQVKQIGSAWYGFDYSGKMYADTTFSLYDNELGRSVYYRAKDDGALYVNAWLQTSSYYSDWYYYGEAGAAPNGPYTVGGQLYYFRYDGRMEKNSVNTMDGATYYSDENGYATRYDGTGWKEINGQWYYLENGERVTSQTRRISGVLYYFTYDGTMLKDSTSNVYKNGRSVYYRAKESGALYAGEWYDGAYYYNADGESLYGPARVDGKLYCFDSSGRMMTDTTYTFAGVTYTIGTDGVATTTASEGWQEIDGSWYYFENGVPKTAGVYQISGAYYYFNSNGVMHEEGTFSMNDGTGRTVYYRAKEGGKLYVNAWYEDTNNLYWYYDDNNNYVSQSTWYYYGAEGKAASGPVKVGDSWYFFDSNGKMRINSTSVGDDGYTYISNVQGKAVWLNKEGWTNVNGVYYYSEGGTMVKDQVKQIGGAWYGFDYNGRMYADRDFDFYDEDAERSVYYRAAASGKLYVNTWFRGEPSEWHYDDNDQMVVEKYAWYYYGAEGKSAYGPLKIGNQWYFFDYNGRMATDTTNTWDDGYTYISDEDGKTAWLNKDGWTNVNSVYYYCEGGEVVRHEVRQIGGKWYAFDYNGRMLTDDTMSVYDEELDRHVYYRAKANGELYMNAWYADTEDSDWYYDENGERIERTTWYYYGAGGKAVCGPVTVGGQLYYFNNSGRLLYDGVNVDDATGTIYASDETGKAYVLAKNGWTQAGKYWYYSENGEIVKGQSKQISGKWYAFNYSGRMITGTTMGVYDNDLGRSVSYRAKADGQLYVNEWYKDSDYPDWRYDDDGNYVMYYNWYYYGAEGKAAYGPLTLNGKLYYFGYSGQMTTDATNTYNNESYISDFDGNAYKLNKNGWTQVGKYWYYCENGVFPSEETKQINGDWYGFDYRGRMLTDGVFSFWHYDHTTDVERRIRFCAKADGKLYVNTWVGWTYYGADGTCPDGVATVNGVKYYFDSQGAAVRSEYVLDNGVLYYAGTNGAVSAVTADGLYVTNDGYRVAVASGAVLKSQWKKYGDSWYYFTENGQAARGFTRISTGDKSYDYYFFNPDGAMVSGGWITYNGGYLYAGADGKLLTGSQKINGVWYYFDIDGIMLTGIVTDKDGKTYLYAANGAYIGAANASGWSEIDGSWYYAEDGHAVYGTKTIDGKTYFFDYGTGAMLVNRRYDNQIFNQSGVRVESGWYKLNESWYYVSPEKHVVQTGDLEIDGKKYFMSYDGMVIGDYTYNNELRVYDNNGVLTGTTTYNKNGWTLFNGVYYYYKDGKAYTGWVGKYYIRNGRMLRNQITPDGYYVDNTGAYVSGGWINEAHTRYAQSNGKLAKDQWLQIDGVWYYFTGYYVTEGPAIINGVLYLFDYDGKLVSTAGQPVDGKWYSCKINGQTAYTYLEGGEPIRDESRVIDGVKYYFDSYYLSDGGYWYADNQTNERFYINANGTRANYTGWQKINNGWYYFDSNHAVMTGWFTVGGKTYYGTTGSRGIYTGYRAVGGGLYLFGSDGALQGQITKQNGWLKQDDVWYYFVNGRLITGGIYDIDGKTYGFTGGHLAKNTVVGSDYTYYTDANGVIVKNTWEKINGEWFYFGANGRMLTGIRVINGTTYYFTSPGHSSDDDYYYDDYYGIG